MSESSLNTQHTSTESESILQLEGVSKHFDVDSGLLEGIRHRLTNADQETVRAVEDVSFDVKKGETFGLVGESGCGKSTLARAILQLIRPTGGRVYFQGEDLCELSQREIRSKRRDMQMVFQDPQSSLNPRLKVGQIIEEPMEAHGILDEAGREEKARELLSKVGLSQDHYDRYPHAFSGGQRQRINLARALSVEPDLVVCDEPVSALDVSVQAQVLNLMADLQDEFDLTYIIISHDLSVIRYICDRVAVMYLGHIVELAESNLIFDDPKHPYTRALLGSIPVPDPQKSEVRSVIRGEVPSPINPPSGCRFRTRCQSIIPAEQYDFSDEAWQTTLDYIRSVKYREISSSTFEATYEEIFGGVQLDPDAERIIRSTLEDVHANKWEQATETLTETFIKTSICAQERPIYRIKNSEGSRYVECHLYRNQQ
ncbi:ABC transporter ATP-binding protein [Natronosalvus halobius]|uniref:ABC transporter ATP-binding protein n=1 Tax=Natronosalvus halobius TaxID=2953746 RepID=UPI0020A1BC99|nr:oligopeptide/dipeptide ABC transporter ATP-binding protein [Natronosalvus halobius]USZ73687.1 ATP-binding cassette domain-containing protein [Natronosalvus halobius]